MAHIQAYDINMSELRELKARYAEYFNGLLWPRNAVTIKVAFSDEQVMALVAYWSFCYRTYDEGIAWNGYAIDEEYEEVMQSRLSYWSRVWDAKKVREIHDVCYTGFREPTEQQCVLSETTSKIERSFGVLPILPVT